MNEREIRHKFFYAMQEARMYDTTIQLVAPYYREMHEMMLRLAVEGLPDRKAPSDHPLALDIGCGTGEEAIPLLNAISSLRLLGIDLCTPMMDEFRRNAEKARMPGDRYHLLVGDILDTSIAQTLKKAAVDRFRGNSFQLIISAFTLHHLSTDEKANVFRMAHGLLDDEGVFLLGDLFNYGEESAWLTNNIFTWETNWIADNFDKARSKAASPGNEQAHDDFDRLKEQWLDHYSGENKLDSVTTQMRLLREAGFSQVGNPFRYWQVGLVWARKQ